MFYSQQIQCMSTFWFWPFEVCALLALGETESDPIMAKGLLLNATFLRLCSFGWQQPVFSVWTWKGIKESGDYHWSNESPYINLTFVSTLWTVQAAVLGAMLAVDCLSPWPFIENTGGNGPSKSLRRFTNPPNLQPHAQFLRSKTLVPGSCSSAVQPSTGLGFRV